MWQVQWLLRCSRQGNRQATLSKLDRKRQLSKHYCCVECGSTNKNKNNTDNNINCGNSGINKQMLVAVVVHVEKVTSWTKPLTGLIATFHFSDCIQWLAAESKIATIKKKYEKQLQMQPNENRTSHQQCKLSAIIKSSEDAKFRTEIFLKMHSVM